jgi:hypothetical protein
VVSGDRFMKESSRVSVSCRLALVCAVCVACTTGSAKPGPLVSNVSDATSDPPRSDAAAHDAAEGLVDADPGADVGTASVAPCSSPGYGPGPELSADAGHPSFVVLFNCLWPSHQRMEISLALAVPAKRGEIERLLRGLWKNLQTSMGKDFPETVKLCVFAPHTTISDTPLGCIRKGYEPEGEPGEEEADLRIDMRPEPADIADGVAKLLGKGFVGANRPRATFDAAKHELTVVYPYMDAGTDRWATKPSYVDVVIPLFVLAWDFYPPKSDLTALTFEGTWKGMSLLRVHLRGLDDFLAMRPWAVRQRLGEAHIPYALGAARTDEQNAAIRRELAAALASLPKGLVTIEPSSR